MSRRKRKKGLLTSQDEALINLMPLIDVVFVVLVMFIVIAPMLEVEHVELAQGSTTIQERDLKKSFSVHIRSDNSYWIEKKCVDDKELLQALLSHHQSYPQKTSFQVFQDKDSSFGTYQEIREIAQKAGFSQIDVILKPSK